MAKYSPANLTPEVAERARRLARHNGKTLGAYIGDLVDAAHVATFGDAPHPVFIFEYDATGKPTSFTLDDGSGLKLPASLAVDLADHVERVALKGGASAELSDDGYFLDVSRHGAAVVIKIANSNDGTTTKWSAGVHRAEQVAAALYEKAMRENILAKLVAANKAAGKAA